jgi:7-cyano-7-deazaguanine synthase in queuosine biosynthesis
LHDALSFVTGDRWRIGFYQRDRAEPQPQQRLFSIPSGVEAVIPFSNGLDSRAVGQLAGRTLGDRVVRIRLGSALSDGKALARERHPFTAVPYKVRSGQKRLVESSARSRGFKFAVISGLAAYLANARQIIVPESGHGALGPALVTVGQGYEDYRSHPLFTVRMERFFKALLRRELRYVFPRLWFTKGETLRAFIEQGGDHSWSMTRSCWRQNRHVSVDGKRRQCGVCAACMLRRMSIHAAGLSEPPEVYVWADLSAARFERGAARSYWSKGKITNASREYAIAGALHLDHLAGLLDSQAHKGALGLAAFQLAGALRIDIADAQRRLERLLRQHSSEWEAFMRSLGASSFVADWAMRGRP